MSIKVADSSQTALLAVAGVLIVLGGMMLSPEGSILVFAAAGLLAFLVLVAGASRKKRTVALFIFAATVLFSIAAWRKHPSSFERYREAVRPAGSQEPLK